MGYLPHYQVFTGVPKYTGVSLSTPFLYTTSRGIPHTEMTMRFITRGFLAATLACLFIVGTFATTPVSAWCGQWPSQNCKQGETPTPDLADIAGIVWRGVRLTAGLTL